MLIGDNWEIGYKFLAKIDGARSQLLLALCCKVHEAALRRKQMSMAEARSSRYSVEMEPISHNNQYSLVYSDSDSDKEGLDDFVAPLRKHSVHEEDDRMRSKTCSSVCSCSGAQIWQPPEDPSEINMLDVP